jgi:Icc-related predicted phosphoesterase
MTVRIAAVGDLHCTRASQGKLQPLFAEMSRQSDVLALCGDLTDYGLPDEAHVLATELKAAANVPIVAVLGNHDFESAKEDELVAVLKGAGIHVLDGDTFELNQVGFAGVKGFYGGFGPRALQAWGEPITKQLVHEAVNQALKLEAALARLRTPQRVVLLHYSPIQSTVEGEPQEIYPFVGSSRLEEPLHRHPVHSVFHGHAHRGKAEGHTTNGIPVYNVALPLLSRVFPDRPPFRVVTIHGRT